MIEPTIPCPDDVAEVIDVLAQLWFTVQRNNDNPFQNTGGGNFYNFGVFVVRAYCWSEEGTPYNFRWRDFYVSWYKDAVRGVRISRDISTEELAEMRQECVYAMMRDPRPADEIVW